MTLTALCVPCIMLRTLGGNPALVPNSTSSNATSISFSVKGFIMNLLPQVTAIGNIQSRILAGKLNGQMHAHTPSGCQMLHVSMSLETFSKFSHLWNYHPTFLLCHFLQAWLNPKDYNHILIQIAIDANQVKSIFSIRGSSQTKARAMLSLFESQRGTETRSSGCHQQKRFSLIPSLYKVISSLGSFT